MLKKIAIVISSTAAAAVVFLLSAYAVGLGSPSVQESPAFTVEGLKTAAETPLTIVEKSERGVPEARTTEGSVRIGDVRYDAKVLPGATAYDLMEAAREKGLSFESQYFSGLGFFITSIGGTEQEPGEGRYWTLYVNGQRSNLGASNYILKSGDSIEWKLEKN